MMSTYPPAAQRANFIHLYGDIFWFGILAGSAMAFLNIYAARLGASAFQIGLITAGPAMVNLMISLPAGSWMRSRRLIPTSFWSALFQRLGYFAFIFLPILATANQQVRSIILITLVMSLPGALLAISFFAMLPELVPAEARALVIGRRNALVAISTTLAALLSGQLLDRIAFPLNYQVVFAIGAFGAGMSTYHLARLRPVDGGPRHLWFRLAPARPAAFRPHAWQNLPQRFQARLASPDSILRSSLIHGAFARFLFAYLVFYIFQNLCFPLFPLAYVHDLKLTDGMISLGNVIFYGSMFLASLQLNRLAVRYGHHTLLSAGAIGLSLYPLILGVAHGSFLFFVASLVGGLVWGILSASLINRLMDRVPEDQRPAGMALHNLSLNLGILIGSLTGPLLGETIGVQPAILVGAGLRFLAAMLLVAWG